MKREIRVGNVVTVYEDPLTETKPEGRVLIKKKHGPDYFRVEFLADGYVCDRLIKEVANEEE